MSPRMIGRTRADVQRETEERYREATKLLEQGYSFRKAGTAAGVSQYRLRAYARRIDIVQETRPGVQVTIRPRGAIREWYTYTTDGPMVVRLDTKQASRNARYLNAVRAAKRENSSGPLRPFRNADPLIDDVGDSHVWETDWRKLKPMLYPKGGEPPYHIVR